MKRLLAAIVGIAATLLVCPALADEPDYRGIAFVGAFDEAVTFSPTYARGVSVTISGADEAGRRTLRLDNCGLDRSISVETQFQAPGFLFAAFETSDSHQSFGGCEVYLVLYFKPTPGLSAHMTLDEVVISCRRGECRAG